MDHYNTNCKKNVFLLEVHVERDAPMLLNNGKASFLPLKDSHGR